MNAGTQGKQSFTCTFASGDTPIARQRVIPSGRFLLAQHQISSSGSAGSLVNAAWKRASFQLAIQCVHIVRSMIKATKFAHLLNFTLPRPDSQYTASCTCSGHWRSMTHGTHAGHHIRHVANCGFEAKNMQDSERYLHNIEHMSCALCIDNRTWVAGQAC